MKILWCAVAWALGWIFANVVLGGPVEELGRMLYHDSRVSKPNTTSCAHCHKLENGTTDGLKKAVGLIGADLQNFPLGRVGPRKTMPTLNVGVGDHFNQLKFWDGRAKNLDDQATGPMENPDEMGNQTKEEVANRISNIPGYTPLIRAAYGHDRLSVAEMRNALARFQAVVLRAVDTPAYRYLYLQEKTAISDELKHGALLFHTHCLQCHSGNTFTTGGFANNGLEMVLPSSPPDEGLAKTTQNDNHTRMFKIPTLVGIDIRAPYGHNGCIPSLERMIAHYANGGAYVDPLTKKPMRDSLIDDRVKRIKLNKLEQYNLLTFMSNAFVAYDMPKKEDIVPRSLP